MMYNHFVIERLSRERAEEALREAQRGRLARLAETTASDVDSVWRKMFSRMLPAATGS